MRFKIIVFSLLLLLLCGTVFTQESQESAYVKGRVILKVNRDIVHFPLEVYGVYFTLDDSTIRIDSVNYQVYKKGSRVKGKRFAIKRELRLEAKEYKKKHPHIFEKIRLNLPSELITLFKKYDVYHIERIGRAFAPEDTLPHEIQGRLGRKIVKSPNYNRYLRIEFSKDKTVIEFCNELEKLDYVTYANPSYYVYEFAQPTDTWWDNTSGGYDQEKYMGFNVMDFEEAWSTVKGENPEIEDFPIRIAFIDKDFSYVDFRSDLAANCYWSPATGNGTGHGTEVASVACAVTDNSYLIAGATWNCSFVPYTATTVDEINDALISIKSDITYTHTYVINMSIGYNIYDDDVQEMENHCNDLYENYDVLIVAAVSDISGASSNIVYPAGFNSVIGVGASNGNDNELIASSNWGNDVEVVATGESIFVLKYDEDDYDIRTGTSVATPFVSSLCALILSTEKGYEMSNYKIRNKMKSNAKQIYDHGKTFYRINANNTINSILTGIEDEIIISDGGQTILTPNNTYSYRANFYDYSPTGDYIAGIWYWKLIGLLSNGSKVLTSEESTGRYSSNWDCTVPIYDTSLNWVRDDNNRVLAEISVSAMDNDGVWHYDNYYVKLNDPPPLSITISGPTSLGSNETGTFTANPSGGSGSYTDYRWWERNDEGEPEPFKAGNTIMAPQPGIWLEIPSFRGKQQITIGHSWDFSLKCEVTDSFGDKATDIHSVNVGGGFAKAASEEGPAIAAVQIPEEFVLQSNYPNPFNPSTTIRFGLPEASQVTINIYSLTGEKVKTLVNGAYPAGYHTAQWDGTNEARVKTAAGVYVYELKAGGKRLIKKMILTK